MIIGTGFALLWYTWAGQIKFTFSEKDGTSVSMGHHMTRPFDKSQFGEDHLIIDTSALVVIFLSCVYMRVHMLIGFVTFLYAVAINTFFKCLIHLDTSNDPLFGGNLYNILLVLFIFSWITQFLGHGVFEKRAPALLTNLLFAFIAPFFAVFEMLNMILGYKQAEIKVYQREILSDIAFYRQKRGLPMMKGYRIK